MKLLKMKIKRMNIKDCTHYDYPTPYYNAYKVIFGPVYEGGLEENVTLIKARNTNDEFIIIGVEDSDLNDFLKANGYKDSDGFEFSCIEITQAEAEQDGTQWTKQIEKITDQNKVITILAKIGRGEILTQQEKDALNPDNLESGINKTKSFVQDLQATIDSKTIYKTK